MTNPLNGAPMPVDYSRIASHIKAMEPRALTADQFTDVVTLIEWMRNEITKQDEALEVREADVAARERAVKQRERDVAIRQRVVGVAMAIKPRGMFGKYLKG